MIKHVAGGNRTFLSKCYSGEANSKNIPVNGPAGTMTCTDSHALVQPTFLVKYLGNQADTGINSGCSIDGAAPTLTTQNRIYLTQCAFLSQRNGGDAEERVVSLDGPARTVTTTDGNQQLVQTVIRTDFMVNYYSSGGQLESLDAPTGTLLPIPKQRLVSAMPFLMANQHANAGTNVDIPAPCILTGTTDRGNHHYLLTPSALGDSENAGLPPFVRIENGYVYILLDPDELPVLRQIKLFMAYYGIVDIRMRMLRVREIKRIQGFTDDYYLAGSQTHQKKFLGNAVIPLVAQRWIEALYEAYEKLITSSESQLTLPFLQDVERRAA